jgi:hypothetical protein
MVELAAEVSVVEACELFDRPGERPPRLLPDGVQRQHRDDVANELEILQLVAPACVGRTLVFGVDVLAVSVLRSCGASPSEPSRSW